ncbi:MAG TPA: LCP family protein [Candidatus Dormibacteraeota bacterium]|nr:LCP family protein [Candidatus Dormibacteraeota bacterium]
MSTDAPRASRPRRRRRSAQRRSLLPSRGAVIVSLLVALGFALSGAAGAAAYFLPAITTGHAIVSQGGLPSDPAASGPSATARPDARSGDPFTVLLLGSDNDSRFAGDHLLTQSMILVRVVPASKQVTMLSIPRDLWVPIAGGRGDAKIDTAFSDGGGSTAASAGVAVATVEQTFGVHVDHWVWIGLKGLVSLIDTLGGVDVVTTNPVLDDFYPADLVPNGNPYLPSRVAVLPGAQHMTGYEAMQYVRSRHGDIREDFGRSERQQQVLLALRVKARNLDAFDLPRISGALSGQLATDMGYTQIGDLLPLAGGLDPSKVHRVLLLPPYTHSQQFGDQDAVVGNWDLIRPLVSQTFPP